MKKKKLFIDVNTDIESDISKNVKNQKSEKITHKNYCNHVCDSIPLIIKSFKFKILDDYLLGDEHVIKVSPEFSTPRSNTNCTSSEEKRSILAL